MLVYNSLLSRTFSLMFLRAAITLFALFLASCGGSSQAPSITPPPAPPPSPQNLQDMTGVQNLKAKATTFATRNNDVNMFVGQNIQTDATIVFNNNTNELRLVLSQQLTNNETYSVDVTVDRDTDLQSVVNGYMTLGKEISPTYGVVIKVVDPTSTIPTIGQLKYVSGGFWLIANPSPFDNDAEVGAIVGGFETANANMPTTGNATYNIQGSGIYAGRGVVGEINPTGTMDVAFSAGEMTGRFQELRLFELLGTAYLGTVPGFTMTGSISNGLSDFSGAISRSATGSVPSMTGNFSGSFYGPSAEEIGAVFQLGTGGISQVNDVVITGSFVGKK